MEDYNDIPNWIKKSRKQEVPDDFFENFSSQLMEKIQSEDSQLPAHLKLNSKPSVPSGFFDSFGEEVQAKIKEHKSSSRGKIIRMRNLMMLSAAAAAVLLIVFFSRQNFQSDEIISPNTANLETESNYDDYLVYLDDDEIVDYIIDNGIELENADDVSEREAVYDYVGDDIEEIYTEL